MDNINNNNDAVKSNSLHTSIYIIIIFIIYNTKNKILYSFISGKPLFALLMQTIFANIQYYYFYGLYMDILIGSHYLKIKIVIIIII